MKNRVSDSAKSHDYRDNHMIHNTFVLHKIIRTSHIEKSSMYYRKQSYIISVYLTVHSLRALHFLYLRACTSQTDYNSTRSTLYNATGALLLEYCPLFSFGDYCNNIINGVFILILYYAH